MIQPSHVTGCVAFFRVDVGKLPGLVTFSIQPAHRAKPESWKLELQDALQSITPTVTKAAMETMEHLALLKRWYYRGSRIGEIFFADSKGELPHAPRRSRHLTCLPGRETGN